MLKRKFITPELNQYPGDKNSDDFDWFNNASKGYKWIRLVIISMLVPFIVLEKANTHQIDCGIKQSHPPAKLRLLNVLTVLENEVLSWVKDHGTTRILIHLLFNLVNLTMGMLYATPEGAAIILDRFMLDIPHLFPSYSFILHVFLPVPQTKYRK